MSVMDAEEAPFNGTAKRIPPGHDKAWVRLEGRWWRGWVHHWYRQDGRWVAWMQHARPDGWPWGMHAAYWYDPEVIRPRVDGEPPPDAGPGVT